MKVTCSSCGAEYQIDDRKIPASGAFVTCKTCSAKIKLTPPGAAAQAAPAGAVALPGSGPGKTPPAPVKTAAAIPLPGNAAAAAKAPVAAAIPLPSTPPAGDEALRDDVLAGLSGADIALPAVAPARPAPAAVVSGGAIPLSSKGGAIPLSSSGGAIPLSSSGGAIPLSSSGGAIPLSSSGGAAILGESAAKTAAKAVPLPTAARASVPLPGVGAARPAPPAASAPLAPAPTPSRLPEPAHEPRGGATPFGVDLSGGMPFTDPEAGAPSLAPLELAPTPRGTPSLELDLPGRVEDTPAAGSSNLDALFDLPAAVTDAPAAPTPSFLQDLPAADDGSVPALGAAPAAGDSPAPGRLDDLPSPDDGTPPLDDLPPAEGGAAAEPPLDDLPIRADVAPSLMDDLPIPALGAPVGASAPPFDDLGATPALGDPFAAVAETTDAAGVRLEAVAGAAAAHAAEAPAAAKPRRKVPVALLAVAGVVALLGGALQVAPMLGFDPFADPEVHKPAPPPPKPVAKPATAAAPPAAKPAAPPTAPRAAPPPVETVPLTAANVDTLAYGTLRKSCEALAAQAPTDGEARDLLWWAWFRLAHTFGDEAAAAKLLSELPRRLDDPTIGAMGAAAGIGVGILDDKVPAARKTVERLRKGRFKDSAHLAYVAGLAFAGPGPKAAKLFERAAKSAPPMVDAKLEASAALLSGRNAGQGVEELRLLVKDSKDLDLRVRVAERLVAAGQFGDVEPVLGELTDVSQVEHVAPARRAATALLLSRLRLRQGDLDGALAAAKNRVELEPTRVAAVVDLARFEQSAERNGAETLALAYQRSEDETDRSQLVAEQVRLALARGDVPGATTLLDGAAELSKKNASGWLKLAEGWIAAHSGKVPRAKAAYLAAGKARPKFVEPKLALIVLEPGPPPQELARLTQLAKLSDLAAVDHHLAKVMAARGNLAGALELTEAVLWSDGLPADPLELLLGWIELLARAGQAARAEELAQRLQKARPKDQRPLRALIDMAESQSDAGKAAEWWRQLVQQNPDNFSYKAALAAHLMSAGRDAEARTMLDDVQGNKEAMKNAVVLYRLGQAWAKREPIKARGFLIEARALAPSAEIHLLLGQIDETRDKLDTAVESYREALTLDPNLDLARRKLARILLNKGDLQDAEVELQDLAARLPNDVEVAELMGDCLRDMEKPKDAIKAYLRAAAVPEPPAPLLLKIGKLQLQSLGQVGPSVRTLRRAVQLDPKAAEGFYLLGYALKDLGRTREAKEALEQYLAVAPKDDLAEEVRADLRDLQP